MGYSILAFPPILFSKCGMKPFQEIIYFDAEKVLFNQSRHTGFVIKQGFWGRIHFGPGKVLLKQQYEKY